VLAAALTAKAKLSSVTVACVLRVIVLTSSLFIASSPNVLTTAVVAWVLGEAAYTLYLYFEFRIVRRESPKECRD
jgi:hypothetical protein